jgi:chromosome segregation ATPase
MEETLKQILSKLNTMEEKVNKIDSIEKELKELKTDVKDLKGQVTGLEGKVTCIEGKIDKLTEREENHFNQVINEIQYVYEGLDKRITPLETKV